MEADSISIANNVRLADCSRLSAEMTEALRQVCLKRSIPDGKVADIFATAQFIQQVWTTQNKAMVDPPAGSGKSQWADAEILSRSLKWGNPLMTVNSDPPAPKPIYLVVETLAAGKERLEGLLALGVPPEHIGFYHSFWEQECDGLRGDGITYDRFLKERGLCKECTKRKECRFAKRNPELSRLAVILTHEGFIRLHERGNILPDRDIIMDEEPLLYLTTQVDKWQVEGFLKQLDKLPSLTPSILKIQAVARDLLALTDDPLKQNCSLRWHTTIEPEAKATAIREVEAAAKALELTIPDIPDSDLRDAFLLPRSLALIYTLGYALIEGSTAYVYCDGKRIMIARDRIHFDIPNRIIILNASAQVSRYLYPEEMGIWTCSDLKGEYRNVTLHCLCGLPTKNFFRKTANVETLIEYAKRVLGRDEAVFLVFNKPVGSEDGDGELEQVDAPADLPSSAGDPQKPPQAATNTEHNDLPSELRQAFPKTALEHVGYRGTTKGSNKWQNLSKGVIATSWFSEIGQYVLSASLRTGNEFTQDDIFTTDGSGRKRVGFTKERNLKNPDIRDELLRQMADDLYQTIMRLSCRRDRSRPVHVVIVVPNIDVLRYLYTLMPRVAIDSDKTAFTFAEILLTTHEPIPNAAFYRGLGVNPRSGGNILKAEKVADAFGWAKRKAINSRGHGVEWVRAAAPEIGGQEGEVPETTVHP